MARKSKTVRPTAPDGDWQVREALSTLTRAEAIKGDAKMMAKVRPLAQQQKTLVVKLDDLCGSKHGGSNGKGIRYIMPHALR